MIVIASIVDGPVAREVEARVVGARAGLPADRGASVADGRVGASVRFEGVVRRMEPSPERGGSARELAALEYQTYDPMAQRELEALARAVLEGHGLESIVALHSRGRVGVGEVSFVLTVTGAHRAEVLAGVTEYIDRLKRDVPIWKRAVWAG